ncbi:hypothetical protein FJZ22_03245 [Candidatus Pacearchaeota archaeon]|nr:hypothetical protein [Candidatus Pacearchaeota archaeon]
MKRGQLVQENLANIVIALAVVAIIVLAILAFRGQLGGLNVNNVPLNSIVASCNVAAGLEQGKAEYCTLSTYDFTELDGRSQYVTCAYLAGKGLLEQSAPIFGVCPSSAEEAKKVFCASLVAKGDLKRDTYVDGKPCTAASGVESWLGTSYETATRKETPTKETPTNKP